MKFIDDYMKPYRVVEFEPGTSEYRKLLEDQITPRANKKPLNTKTFLSIAKRIEEHDKFYPELMPRSKDIWSGI